MKLAANQCKRRVRDTAHSAALVRLPLAVAAKKLTLCDYISKSHLNKKTDSQDGSFCLAADSFILLLSAAPDKWTILV